ncbi:MAG: cytidine deaminase [Prevotella sp.]|nr:cytidine deaminase [Bacteroides sp.]MCM1367156.1 cytidine deaminase [Prevotella sp.]
MKTLKIETAIKSVQYDELDARDKVLVDAAKEATKRSLAHYSHFNVGAAILMENGEMVTGSNQENAAYPSGTCAERTACFYASSKYPGVGMKKLAIAAWTPLHHPEGIKFEDCFQAHPISPCGACRQALLEYEHLYGPIEVLLYGKDEIYILPSISSLLPLTFTKF